MFFRKPLGSPERLAFWSEAVGRHPDNPWVWKRHVETASETFPVPFAEMSPILQSSRKLMSWEMTDAVLATRVAGLLADLGEARLFFDGLGAERLGAWQERGLGWEFELCSLLAGEEAGARAGTEPDMMPRASGPGHGLLTEFRRAREGGAAGEEAVARLEAAMAQGGRAGLRAGRLLFRFRLLAADAPAAGRVLAWLQAQGAESLAERAAYWRLLLRSGRAADVLGELERLPLAPRTAGMAAWLAEFLAEAELAHRGLEVVTLGLALAPDSATLDRLRLELLIQLGAWEAVGERLQAMSPVAESDPRRGAVLLAEYALARFHGKTRDAWAGAKELAAMPGIARSTLRIALMLLRRNGDADWVVVLAKRHLPAGGGDAVLWREVFVAAQACGDLDEAERAARELRRCKPGDWIWDLNLAAVLVSRGERVSEALALTTRLVGMGASPPAVLINHALALLANQRGVDAAYCLSGVSLSAADPRTRTYFHYAMALLRKWQGDPVGAAAEAQKAHGGYLGAEERKRLSTLLTGF